MFSKVLLYIQQYLRLA